MKLFYCVSASYWTKGSLFSESSDLASKAQSFDATTEGLFSRFEAFLTRAATCHNIFPATSSSRSNNLSRLHIILLEDLPNVLHHETQARFHQTLISLVNSPPSEPPVPVVIIVSDAGTRGEEWDEKRMEGRGFGRDKNQVVDGRTVIPKELLHGVYVTEIGYGLYSANRTDHSFMVEIQLQSDCTNPSAQGSSAAAG
jgi:cell cycle checkpoint protein